MEVIGMQERLAETNNYVREAFPKEILRIGGTAYIGN
jgi:hypothetical protein